MQAHGSDAMVDEEHCVFFLPHRPRTEICDPPFFLLMKGTGNQRESSVNNQRKPYELLKPALIFKPSSHCAGWCGAGADHYEPLIARPSCLVSPEKVAVLL